jgi:hypothetical protein
MKTFDSSFESSFCDAQLPPILTQLKQTQQKAFHDNEVKKVNNFPTKLLTCFQPSEGFISKNSRDLSKMPCIVTFCQNWIKERQLTPKTSKSTNTYRLRTLPQVLIGSLL